MVDCWPWKLVAVGSSPAFPTMRYSSKVRAGALYAQGYRFKPCYLNNITICGVMDNTPGYEPGDLRFESLQIDKKYGKYFNWWIAGFGS